MPYLCSIQILQPFLYELSGHVRNLQVTWSYGVVFAGYSGFLHYLQLASHELSTIGKNENCL